MKGTTTIQLFDAETGKEKEHVVSDNIITNFYKRLIEEYINNFQISCFAANFKYFLEYWSPQMASSGIILFDSVLSEDKNRFLPYYAGCVGHAGGDYAGNSTYRGDYNASESGPITNGYKHVWDFGTDKANGTIRCACLTTEKGGNYGYKEDLINESGYGDADYSLRGGSENLFSTYERIDGDLYGRYKGMDSSGTYYLQEGTSGTIRLKKFKKPTLSPVAYGRTLLRYVDEDVVSKILDDYTYLELSMVNDVLYGLQYNSKTKELYLKTFDTSLTETSSLKLTNTNELQPYYSDSYNFAIKGGYVYAFGQGSPKKLLKWDATNGNYITGITSPFDNSGFVTNFDDDFISLGYDKIYYLCDGSADFYGAFYNYGSSGMNAIKRLGATPYIIAKSGSYSEHSFGIFGACLFSINNLASPVTKTSANTMKVTYQLTW
jgi:hypothetical protein